MTDLRNLGDIRVEHAIVHLVDHLGRDQPLCSQVELRWEGKEATKVRLYFERQIANASTDSAASAAKFEDDSDAFAPCRAILDSHEQLVPASQSLAKLLFKAMAKDGRIRPGSLAVCLFSSSTDTQSRSLALIKIDPSEMLRQKISEGSEGPTLVTFEILDNVLPSQREKLQKAALIPGSREEGEPELLLLDRQVAKVAANFFARGFLGATPELDARQHTQRLHSALIASYNLLLKPNEQGKALLTTEEGEDFRSKIDVAITAPTINLDEWIPNLGLAESAIQVVAKAIDREIGPDRQFELDPDFGKRRVEKTRFRGDFGFLLEYNSDHQKDIVKEKLPLEGGKTRLVLDVPNLNLVKG